MKLKRFTKSFCSIFLAASLAAGLFPAIAFGEIALDMDDVISDKPVDTGQVPAEGQPSVSEPPAKEDVDDLPANDLDAIGVDQTEPFAVMGSSADDEEGNLEAEENDNGLGPHEDDANSFRFVDGELIHSSEGANPASSNDSGISTFALDWHPQGYSVFNSFDTFSNGYCTGSGYMKGIDVSVHNGYINWPQVKASGVDYAIIRCGYGNDERGQDDARWLENVANCQSAGMPFGVYIYSYATNTSMALSEANHVLRCLSDAGLSPSSLSYPIYFDMEDKSTASAPLVSIARTFCETIRGYGYSVGVYSSKSWWEGKLSDACFDNWYKWVAQWNTSDGLDYSGASDFANKQMMWQFSDYGIVPGINHRTDLNYSSFWPDTPYAPIYDFDYYINHNPDVEAVFKGNRTDTLNHFLNNGIYEGRLGNDSFDVVSYYNANPDVREAFGRNVKSLYTHYLNHGVREGRVAKDVPEVQGFVTTYSRTDYSPVYNGKIYYDENPDLRAAYYMRVGGLRFFDDQALLAHFVDWGMAEGRRASGSFDVASYYNANPDVRAAFGADLKAITMHYVNHGQREGRICTGVPELRGHAASRGGLSYAPVYDGAYYAAAHGDVRSACTRRVGQVALLDDQALLAHFVNWGMAEGRRASDGFDVHAYRARYGDLRAAYGSDLRAYYMHYVNYGQREGREVA